MMSNLLTACIMSRFSRGFALILTILAGGCESTPDLTQVLDSTYQNSGQTDSALSTQTIAAGLREALEVGSERAVASLGTTDGFLKSAFHIPLPETLRQAQEVSKRFGLSGYFDDVEVKLNRAAEIAAPEALSLFVSAIRQLTFSDVMTIYQGPDDSATRYLERTTSSALQGKMRPIIDGSLSEVGAVTTFNTLASQYNRIPTVTPIEADLSTYVLGHASNAIFTQLASEEAAIREDPVKRTTELLRQMFR